jgi:hypothetical protein
MKKIRQDSHFVTSPIGEYVSLRDFLTAAVFQAQSKTRYLSFPFTVTRK